MNIFHTSNMLLLYYCLEISETLFMNTDNTLGSYAITYSNN